MLQPLPFVKEISYKVIRYKYYQMKIIDDLIIQIKGQNVWMVSV